MSTLTDDIIFEGNVWDFETEEPQMGPEDPFEDSGLERFQVFGVRSHFHMAWIGLAKTGWRADVGTLRMNVTIGTPFDGGFSDHPSNWDVIHLFGIVDVVVDTRTEWFALYKGKAYRLGQFDFAEISIPDFVNKLLRQLASQLGVADLQLEPREVFSSAQLVAFKAIEEDQKKRLWGHGLYMKDELFSSKV